MGACSPCSVLFHVLSFLQVTAVGALRPVCTNFGRDAAAALAPPPAAVPAGAAGW